MPSDVAKHVLNESHILLFLIQFFLLISSAKLLGLFFIRIKQPTVTADILVGVILGPTILGRLFPGVQDAIFPSDAYQVIMLDTVAWIGIFFLLLVTGLEVNFSSIWKHKGRALGIAVSDIIIPIILSLAVLIFLPDRYFITPENRLLFILFISTIMTISAMPVSIRVMQDLKLLRTDLGYLTISALSINDIIGWIVFTIILGIFTHGDPDLQYVAVLIAMTLLFVVLAIWIGIRWIDRIIVAIKKHSYDTGYILAVVSSVGLLFGAITQRIGIHALFGFFIAGLVCGESKNLTENTRSTIGGMVNAVFVPVFFANIGLKIDILQSFDWFLVILLTVMGIGVRFIGAYAGCILAKIPRAQHWPISALHTPGGEMHIVIATLALELQLISENIFVAIIVAAVLSSITLGPALFIILRRVIPATTVQISPHAAMELTSTEKYDALQELSIKAAHLQHLDPQEVYSVTYEREDGMSTALERGIAIPHARMESVRQPAVILGRSLRGIDWDATDGLPAKLVFFILTPADQSDKQLQIYSQLVGFLSVDKNRLALLETEHIAEAVAILNDRLRLKAITG